MSVGYDHVDTAACKRRNIPVGFTPGVLTDAVAELTVSLEFLLSSLSPLYCCRVVNYDEPNVKERINLNLFSLPFIGGRKHI